MLSKNFHESFLHIQNDENAFYEVFYRHFLESSNLIKLAFQDTDMKKQMEMLSEAVKHLVDFFHDQTDSPYLRNLAEFHYDGKRVDSYMYRLFLNSFIAALQDVYPFCDKKCVSDWEAVLSPGIEFMSRLGK